MLICVVVVRNIRLGKPSATDKEVIKAAKISEAYEFINEKEDKFKYRIEERGKNYLVGKNKEYQLQDLLLEKLKF